MEALKTWRRWCLKKASYRPLPTGAEGELLGLTVLDAMWGRGAGRVGHKVGISMEFFTSVK